MIYLASPYMPIDPRMDAHQIAACKQLRYENAVAAAIVLMRESGEAVFSPIAHSHAMHMQSGGDIGGDWQQWAEFDRAIIGACSRFVVLRLDGWEQSHGIAQETEIAVAFGLTPEYTDMPQ